MVILAITELALSSRYSVMLGLSGCNECLVGVMRGKWSRKRESGVYLH